MKARLLFLRWRIIDRADRFLMWLAWKVPKPIAYWVFIRMASNCDGNPFEQNCGEVAKQHKDWAFR